MNRNLWLSSLLLLSLAGASEASAEPTGWTTSLKLTNGLSQGLDNGQAVPVGEPAKLIDGSFYIPLRWVSDRLGMTVVWDAERSSVSLTTTKAYLQWDLGRGTASVNGQSSPLEDSAVISNGALLVKLSWIAPFLNVQYTYEPQTASVLLSHLGQATTLYPATPYPEADSQLNSRPVAVFATDKPVYRIGEPVRFIDLSYDADAEGLPQEEWSGQQDAFFQPGTYEVTLRVKDSKGQYSEPYTRTVTVKPEVDLSAADYPWYYGIVGSVIHDTDGVWSGRLEKAPVLQAAIRQPEDRKLLIGADEKVLAGTGVVYRDTLKGKARLYAYPVNGMNAAILWGIAVSNPSADKTLNVRVTNEGRVAPSLLSSFTAAQASVDLLTRRSEENSVEVPAGKTVWLDSALMEPGQGMVQLADISSDQEAVISFAALSPGESLEKLASIKTNSTTGTGPKQGTYASANLFWEAEASKDILNVPKRWTIGDSSGEPPVPGRDAVTNASKSVTGLPGSMYSLRLNHPRKAAIAIRAEKGVLTGTFKVNGSIITLPDGGLTAKDGYLLVYRTTGSEAALDMEYVPAPGSAPQIQWAFVPLDEIH